MWCVTWALVSEWTPQSILFECFLLIGSQSVGRQHIQHHYCWCWLGRCHWLHCHLSICCTTGSTNSSFFSDSLMVYMYHSFIASHAGGIAFRIGITLVQTEISQQLPDDFPLNLVQRSTVPWGWILMTLWSPTQSHRLSSSATVWFTRGPKS